MSSANNKQQNSSRQKTLGVKISSYCSLWVWAVIIRFSSCCAHSNGLSCSDTCAADHIDRTGWSMEFQSRFSPDSDHKHCLVFIYVQSGLAHPFTFSTATLTEERRRCEGIVSDPCQRDEALEELSSRFHIPGGSSDSTTFVIPSITFFSHRNIKSSSVSACGLSQILGTSSQKFGWVRGEASTTNFLFDLSRA